MGDQATEVGWTERGSAQVGTPKYSPQNCSRMNAQPGDSIPEPSGPRLALLLWGHPAPTHTLPVTESTHPCCGDIGGGETKRAGRHPVLQAEGERGSSFPQSILHQKGNTHPSVGVETAFLRVQIGTVRKKGWMRRTPGSVSHALAHAQGLDKPERERWRQENQEFKGNLGYTRSTRPDWAT